VQSIRMNQHALKFQRAQQEFQACALVRFSGVEGSLCDRHSQFPGVERHLGDKASGPIGAIGLRGRTPQGITAANQLVEILVMISDLGDHQLPEQPDELL